MDNKFTFLFKVHVVPEWLNNYMDYDSLIFKLEATPVDTSTFLSELNMELTKVIVFFTEMERTLYSKLESIMQTQPTMDDTSKVEPDRNHSISNNNLIHTSHVNPPWVQLENQLAEIYISLLDLESYIEVNRTGFKQIVTQFEQRHGRSTNYHDSLESRPFMPNVLSEQINRLKRYYAHLFCHDSLPLAIRQMDHYRTEYSKKTQQPTATLIKLNIENTRHHDDSALSPSSSSSSSPPPPPSVPPPSSPSSYLTLPCWNIRIPTTNHLRQYICLLLAILLFITLLNINCFGNHQENYCFALLVFAAILWATEAIPLYATSMALPFLIVLLGVMRKSDGSPLTASESSKMVFGAMFSSTIMMLLGGFALAAALGKYGIAKAFAMHVLSRAGTRPRWILLAIMLVAGFLSMWISNVATPVLCFSLIEPILLALPDDHDYDDHDDDDDDDDQDQDQDQDCEKPRMTVTRRSSRSGAGSSGSPSVVGSCLILGIALASCIGGMTSPISSPQNIITLQYMNPNPGWGIWFMVALPISVLSIFVCWFLLLLVYRPDRVRPHLNPITPSASSASSSHDDACPSKTQIVVMVITMITIALWCAETTLAAYFGSTGIVATLPLFLFFGSGILTKEDLNGFLWSVVVLAQGGMALGEAVTSSGLLQDIALRIKEMVEHLDVMVILAIFSVLMLVFATFVSHTVAALIIVPIVQQVGANLPVPHPNLLVMGAGLACSAGMSLPVSGYPNMSAIMMEHPTSGKPYLTTRDFVVTGGLTSLFCCLLVITMGYGIMLSLGY